jgi:hypothetical protein
MPREDKMLADIWKAIVWFTIGTKRHALWLLATTAVLLGTFVMIKASMPTKVDDLTIGLILGLAAVTIDLMVFSAVANGNREVAMPWAIFAILTLVFSTIGSANILRPLDLGDEQTLAAVAFLLAFTFVTGRVICLITIGRNQSQVKAEAKVTSA